MNTCEARILSIAIDRPLDEAYGFAHTPETFPLWAAGLSSSLAETDRGWIAQTPAGEAVLRFSARNAFGVLDHWVQIEGAPEIYVPLRMVANGDGTLVELILFRQPGMSDADFERDAAAVGKDLAALKRLLEGRR